MIGYVGGPFVGLLESSLRWEAIRGERRSKAIRRERRSNARERKKSRVRSMVADYREWVMRVVW